MAINLIRILNKTITICALIKPLCSMNKACWHDLMVDWQQTAARSSRFLLSLCWHSMSVGSVRFLIAVWQHQIEQIHVRFAIFLSSKIYSKPCLKYICASLAIWVYNVYYTHTHTHTRIRACYIILMNL